jgi:hypothetical protein
LGIGNPHNETTTRQKDFKTMSEKIDNNVTLINVRILYPELFVPSLGLNPKPDDKPQYKLTVLLNKATDGKEIAKVGAVIKKIAAAKWGADIAIPADRQPLKDGDNPDANEMYRGHWYMRLKTNYAPNVSDRQGRRLPDNSPIPAGGDYCAVTMSVATYPAGPGYKDGLTAYLGNQVVFMAKGEPLGGNAGVSLEDILSQLPAVQNEVGAGDLPF